MNFDEHTADRLITACRDAAHLLGDQAGAREPTGSREVPVAELHGLPGAASHLDKWRINREESRWGDATDGLP